MRHWSLTRMLNFPLRSPRSASNKLPGGTRKSFTEAAAFTWSSFRRALPRISEGTRRGLPPWKSSSVSRSAKERIIRLPQADNAGLDVRPQAPTVHGRCWPCTTFSVTKALCATRYQLARTCDSMPSTIAWVSPGFSRKALRAQKSWSRPRPRFARVGSRESASALPSASVAGSARSSSPPRRPKIHKSAA